MFIFVVLGGLTTLGLISFIRYRSICQAESKRIQSQKSIFKPYDIGAMLYKTRDKIHNSPEDKDTSSTSHQRQKNQNEQYHGHNGKNNQYQQDNSELLKNKQTLPLTVALADSGFHGAGAFHKILAIDDNVYAGAERISGDTIDSFSDLSAKLSTYSHNENGLTEGVLNKLKGYVAEEHIADHFAQAGIKADWSDASNQKGWGLMIEGHEINSKLIKDTSSLTEHFKENPNIPVMIPSDAEGIPDHAFYFDPSEGKEGLLEYLNNTPENAVIVNTELSNEAITSSVEESTDVAINGVDIGVSIPYVTLAFSGFREFQLLKKGDTDVFTSLKNISLDSAGVLADAATDAVIGSVVPAVSSVVGMAGRMASNKIKHQAFNKVLEKLKEQTTTLKNQQANIDQKVTKQMEQAIANEQGLLNISAKQSKAKINAQVKQLRKWNVHLEKPSIELKQNLLTELEEQISELSWLDILWPRRSVIAYKLRGHQIKAFIDEVKRQTFRDRGQLFQKFADQGLCRQSILSDIEAIEQQRHTHNEDLTDYIKQLEKDILEQRRECMQKAGEKLKHCILQIREELAPFIRKIQTCQKAVVKEGKKLGKTFDDQVDAA